MTFHTTSIDGLLKSIKILAENDISFEQYNDREAFCIEITEFDHIDTGKKMIVLYRVVNAMQTGAGGYLKGKDEN